MSLSKRIAIYSRVSTHDQKTLRLQLEQCRQYVSARRWLVVQEVTEVGSGVAVRSKREELLKSAKRKQVDIILVWKLDRWGRSVTDLIATLHELYELGVGFISITEALDFTTASGRAMAGLLSILAEFEREMMRERVKAGLAEARRRGKQLGRPRTAMSHKDTIIKMYESKISQSEIARQLGIARRSVGRALQDM